MAIRGVGDTRGSAAPRRGVVAAALTSALLVLVTACGGSSSADDSSGGTGGDGEKNAGAGAELLISPDDGAEDVATEGELRVTITDGTLTEVAVTDPEGGIVAGELDDAATTWEPTEHLATGTVYTVEATAETADGETVNETSTFTTLEAEATFATNWNVPEDATVGTGMIMSITFDAPIENREAVEEAIRVTTEPEVELRGHWFGNQRLDIRPENYWQPGTEVSVEFRTRGVEGAPGVYGTRHNERYFTIGRHQVSTVDAAAKTMRVVRDGEELRTLPVTTGEPGNDTWNGKMVITERLKETRMDGSTVGFEGEYDIEDVPHAMRLSTSGTFVHGNYWASEATFGSQNVSHGCIGLFDKQGANDPNTPAAWFFDNSIIGDVVEVVNSNDAVIAPDNGLGGWNADWSAWGSGQ
ncbi:Ig-like domain-containing protein [Streptomyces sp. ST2-7A]|uniref:L,D-transpeptidase n=1 Tax=Streptomyces sp. ST2-7A TaxID=2907214 RepID=UPI001F2C6D5D|nr:Ig-like domain-containing protein [Streptomyces sp. ST2-7A]MCE7080986.1 Ig-like domain-containing protein [Streptomyces sp. ST2-7A]